MFLARFFLTIVCASASLAVAAGDNIQLPSDPKSWQVDYLGLPAASEKCPGGEFGELGKRVPALKLYAPKDYESVYRTSLSDLDGLRNSDQIYPFYYRTDLPNGRFAGTGGYIVVRGECIIHVQVTLYDN
jgi:hypothetical protein